MSGCRLLWWSCTFPVCLEIVVIWAYILGVIFCQDS